MGSNRNGPSAWARRAAVAGALVSAASLMLAGCSTLDPVLSPASSVSPPPAAPGAALAERPSTIRREQLVGSWGTASYREDKDKKRVEAQARAACKLPYPIKLGPSDGVMMHIADDPKLYELRLKGGSDGKTYLGLEAPPGDFNDREILSINEREIVMRFVDPDANARYGTVVYERCK